MNDDKAIVPSSVVDDFWHLHILDTQKYYADCELFLGYFLHHFPYFGMRSEEDAQNLKTAWENTLAIYEEYFGAPNSTIWKGSNRCPNCGVRCRSKGVLAFDESRPTFKSLNISI
jgi:hypothetical protein